MKTLLTILFAFIFTISFASQTVTFNTAQYNLSITTRLVAFPATSLNLPKYLLVCNSLNQKFPIQSITVTKNVLTGEYTLVITLKDATVRTYICKKPSGEWLVKIIDASFWKENYLYMVISVRDSILKMVDDEDVTAMTMTYL